MTQLWAVPSEGGYLYSDNLSDHLRMEAQALTKFRQFCHLPDEETGGLHRGDTFRWNVYSALRTRGRRLSETTPMPETGFEITQKSMTIYEAGISVPYTGKLQDLGKHSLTAIIDRTLRDDNRKFHDTEAYLQMKRTPLRASPTSGTSTTSVDFTTNSAANTTNNVELGTGHVKAIVDWMKERNIPAYKGDDYVCISHPTTFRTFKNSLESIRQYTETGLSQIFRGELGKYEDTRFVEQNHIPKGGANDSATYDAWTGTADAWNNAKSSWAFFCGGDLITEAPVVPDEVRAKIPSDYGRSKGIAWYYLGGYGLVFDDADNSRIVMWDSAA
jgi:hypothetical protein